MNKCKYPDINSIPLRDHTCLFKGFFFLKHLVTISFRFDIKYARNKCWKNFFGRPYRGNDNKTYLHAALSRGLFLSSPNVCLIDKCQFFRQETKLQIISHFELQGQTLRAYRRLDSESLPQFLYGVAISEIVCYYCKF